VCCTARREVVPLPNPSQPEKPEMQRSPRRDFSAGALTERNSFSRRWLRKTEHNEAAIARGTMNEKAAIVFVTLVLSFGSYAHPTIAEAKPITEAEKRHCEEAYHKYCGAYGLESNALRNCMSRNGRSLPHACIEALIDAGEVSRSEVERRKKSGE
jgi:hypothetical protein